jgi:hypothetical protein
MPAHLAFAAVPAARRVAGRSPRGTPATPRAALRSACPCPRAGTDVMIF